MNNHPRPWTEWLTLAGFCAFLFYFGLGAFGLVGADEPRYAQVAREMLARGDWITPYLYGRPWLEKPVLYYWEAILAYKVFGVHDWAARLPSAVSATALVTAVYVFFRRFRPGGELDAALITASALGMIGFARGASTDMPLAAPFGIAMLAWFYWRESGSRRGLLIFYFFLALATLAKGPVTIVLAALIIGLFALMQREALPAWRTLWPPGVLLFLVVALPWYIAVQRRNPEFFRIFILEHNLARFGSNLYHHTQPFWYFFPVMLVGLIPWTALVVVAFADIVRRWLAPRSASTPAEYSMGVFFLIWAAVPVIFFSLSQSKLPGYILPGVPAGTLLLAEYAHRRRQITGVSDGLHPAWLAVHAGLAAGILAPTLLIAYLLLHRQIPLQAWLTALLLAAVAFAAISITLLKRGLRALRFVTLVPIIIAVALTIKSGGPIIDATLSQRPVAEELTKMESTPLPVATLGVPRQVEYGLAFYRNESIASYDRNQIPAGQHLVVTRAGSQSELERLLGSRRMVRLGSFDPQHLEYFWIAATGSEHQH
ncbi:MAG TPA: glycosyltransferase family 39 protein [Terriglobales bacterium]|nr:glycosyltransferase family 39 protein [Terriglobales bacterium]